ncbi:MBL fold metallo-hydrolase [Clostridium botulinum]|uniref:MBL fold metallo-hydrolase n=1 Tax=Clostridium botulinum TaxID=1491 RepID=A0AA43Y916_CLOBO|nr:MBL fold metallo-hydrolase [Clostridium botulinum]
MGFSKNDDKCFGREYKNDKKVAIIQSDIQFQESLSLNLGRMTAKIFHAVPPHSDDTVLIYILEEKMLSLGDAISEGFFNDGFMDKEKLRELINLIEKTDCKFCVLSHAEPLTKLDLLYYLKSI